jgi:4-oxalocrotonate tautomerase family enzyme
MPFIQVTLAQGRSESQKRDLVLGISRAAAEATGVEESSVRVWLVEVSPHAIAAGGEILAERIQKSAGTTE